MSIQMTATEVKAKILSLLDAVAAGEEMEIGRSDVVDAHVASLVSAGDQVLTSDPDDLRKLLDALSVTVDLVRV